MYIAQKLKEKNITEYLLYMWQVEDIIRANGLDIDRLKETMLAGYQATEGKEVVNEWYENLINMMREEGVAATGHLQININVILNLTELHHNLLSSPKFPFYSGAYYKALPFIVELRTKGGEKEKPELETCFEALYGVLLLRMQQKPIGEATQKAVEAISSFLSMLANYYQKDRAGELKFE